MWQICHCGWSMLFQPLHMHPDKDKLVKAVGNMIRELRMSKNLSIENLANLTGIEYSQLSRIERGKINTSIYHVYRILLTLEISPRNLLELLNKHLNIHTEISTKDKVQHTTITNKEIITNTLLTINKN